MATLRGCKRIARLAALAAVYVAAGELGLSLAMVHASASAVWPATGIALAAFLLLGRRVWPAILAGAFFVNVTTACNAATSFGIAAGNTLEGLLGAALVNRFAGGIEAFERPRDVLRFVVLAGLVATALSASFGVTSLCLGGFAPWTDFAGIWLTWWLGDAGGAVSVAPALVLWGRDPTPGWTRSQWLEAAVLLVVIAGVGTIAFGGLLAPGGGDRSLSFLCLPLTIWTAFRFGSRETAAAVLLLSGIAVWGTLHEIGPVPDARANESLLLLQLFMGVVSVTSLALAAVVAQRRQSHEALTRQAAELARSNADLDEFAHVVSHDLKAPLRAISSLAAWIAEDCKHRLPAGSREQLALLDQRARRMRRLIDGVLAYSRVGLRRAALESVSSRAIAEEVVDSLAPLAAASIRIDAALPVVRYDRVQLAQVFQNLIQNAVQHGGKPAVEVAVSCWEEPGEFEFSVRDDGMGIDASNLERVFQIFHVADPSRNRTGIGLAVVRKIVELHGGTVGVESRPGRGATFRFTIPK
jgi:signal transduction histidine kinase